MKIIKIVVTRNKYNSLINEFGQRFQRGGKVVIGNYSGK
jgi:hypothetical protein